MSGKLYRISTRGYVADIQHILNGFIEQQHKLVQKGDDDPVAVAIAQLNTQGFPLLQLNLKSATTLIHTLIKYQVSTFLAYESTELNEQAIAECLFGETIDLTPQVKTVIDEILILPEVDNLIIDINLQLSNFLEHNTWNVVDVLDFDTSLSVVVSEDIRIREWKQMKGMLEQCDSTLDIDLTPVVTYLKNAFNRRFGKLTVMHMGRAVVVGVGDAMNFRNLILGYVCSRYGFLRKTGQIGPATDIPCEGINQEILGQVIKDPVQRDHVIKELVGSTVEAYGICYRLNRLDDTVNYHVEVTDDNRLVVVLETEGDGVIVNEDHRLKELAESFIRGDYLPPKEREEAERYLQQHAF